jgi:hypothetical protein
MMPPKFEEKRKDRQEPDISLASSKRMKVVHDARSILYTEKIGAHELASAFALASLASMSPTQSNTVETELESRDAEYGDVAIPCSPETRSPVRSTSYSKRVTFSHDTLEKSRQTSRKLSLPSKIKQNGSRPPADFMQRDGIFMRSQYILPPTWMRYQVVAQSGPSSNKISHTYMLPPGDKWICDFCEVAAFDTYEEACIHEETCRHHCSQNSQTSAPLMRKQTYSQCHSAYNVHQPSLTESCVKDANAKQKVQSFFHGSTSLAIADSDSDWLSGLNCFIREHCVEAFSATEDDANKSSKRGRIVPLQVGIRCTFCKHRSHEEKQIAAVSYPASLAGIYESVKRWQKVHMSVCKDIPDNVKEKLDGFGKSQNAWVPTTRQYWIDSARALGMIDSPSMEGIRFAIDPTFGPVQFSTGRDSETSPVKKEERQDFEEVPFRKEAKILTDGDSIVLPEDMSMVPPYVYFLMRQVEATHFTEADRFVARSKGPIGYAGFQCRHCHGHAGLGKYFPVTSKSLSTNSTSQNIHSHLLKCRKVSTFVKEQLVSLKEEKSKAPRLEPGWRRVFFDKIWARLHGDCA